MQTWYIYTFVYICIYIVCDNIVIVLTMCNLTIEYFAKIKQNTYGVHAYISLRGNEAGETVHARN